MEASPYGYLECGGVGLHIGPQPAVEELLAKVLGVLLWGARHHGHAKRPRLQG